MNYKYIFDVDRCWYKDSCNLYKKEECGLHCVRYMEMYFLMASSNLPENKQQPIKLIPTDEDKKAYLFLKDIKSDILNFVTSGKNLYIYSKNFGNGKTSWAVKLLHSYFNQIWLGNGFRRKGIFISVPDFLYKIKNAIGHDTDDLFELRSDLLTVDLVIWDDIGATKLSAYDYSQLLYFIDQRVLNNLSNIYTGNLNGVELSDAIGERLKSRVWNNSLRIEFKGTDRRACL